MDKNTENYQDTNKLSSYELQALDFCNKHEVSISFKKIKTLCENEHKNYYRNVYRVIVDRPSRGCKPQGFTFTDSIQAYWDKDKPTAYDFLACITRSDPIDFKTFCDEYGYSDDSIKAKQTYRSVKNEWIKVNLLFGDCLEELSEIA